MDSDPSEAIHHIGTVASLTGLDVHRIRAWERRHGAIRPQRSQRGTRLYSAAEVRRLQLIKAATDCGDPIGAVARMTNEALRARVADLARNDGEARGGAAQIPRVALLGLRAPAAALAAPECEIVCTTRDAAELVEALEDDAIHVIAACLDALGSDPAAELEGLGRAAPGSAMLVVYDFATGREIEQLQNRRIRLVQGPLGGAELRRAIFDSWVIHRAVARARGRTTPDPSEASDRIFNDEQLAQLRELRSSVRCECPNHLALMISKLIAFERYSESCEAREPSDAELHVHLRDGTARARREIERLLAYLCEVDGIRLRSATGSTGSSS